MNSRRFISKSSALLAVIGLWAGVERGDGIDIQFDFSRDTLDFYGSGNPDGAAAGAQALATLNAAGGFFEGVLDDDFDQIQQGGINTWSADFTNPSTGAPDSTAALFVPANSLVIYVGARDIGGSSLGEAGPGGFSASGTSAWFTAIRERGEGAPTTGAGATEFAPWGGSVSIDHDGSSNWNYDYLSTPGAGQDDLYSVLLHELGHVLGVGTADSWDNLISGASFTGAASEASYGSQPSVTGDGGHWADGTDSDIYGTKIGQETAFDPSILEATRKVITDLDVAGLDDLGWDIAPIPEPGTTSMLALVTAGLLFGRRRR